MRAPGFWSRPPGALAALLSPLSRIYAMATARRVSRPGWRAPVPVICVGNLTVGGTGKTPLVMDLLERLSKRGVCAHVLSRGHGGSLTDLRVDPRKHSAAEVGDEPLLLSAFGPVWIGADREVTARMAVEAGARALILDDGFQNPTLEKDLSIVVVDAEVGFGNGRVIPAGPLREPVAEGLRRADLVLTIGPDAAQRSFNLPSAAPPRLTGRFVPLETGMRWERIRAFAFAGIGRPEKFFDSLRATGATIVGTVSLDDHQPLTPALMARIERAAEEVMGQLVTTEKDAARLPASWRGKVLTLPVRIAFVDIGLLEGMLEGVFAGPGL